MDKIDHGKKGRIMNIKEKLYNATKSVHDLIHCCVIFADTNTLPHIARTYLITPLVLNFDVINF
jgi:hypothetical protein